MSNPFTPWHVDQRLRLPLSVQELVSAGQLAHFVRDTVRDSRALSASVATYPDDRECPPYAPTLMTARLLEV